MDTNEVVLIGYSGHSFPICDTLIELGVRIKGYCELQEKKENPFDLTYLGKEEDLLTSSIFDSCDYFIAIGDNKRRELVSNNIYHIAKKKAISITHPCAIISDTCQIAQGTVIFPGAIINALSQIGTGTICNSNSVIEHECQIGEFCHVAPSATLCGDVKVGKGSFIGANAVIKEGIKIGNYAVIGAGSVVVRDIAAHEVVYGNPAKKANEVIK